MSIRVRSFLAVLCFATLGVTIACSGHGDRPVASKNQEDLQMCFGDSGFCIDADVPGWGGDAGFPGWGDAGSWPPPGFPDAGSFSYDAAGPLFGYCGWDPKYVTEY